MNKQEIITLGSYRIVTIETEKPWAENCYLISHLPSGEQVVIDPGGNADSIIRAIHDNGIRLRYILLTHAHHDHVGAAAKISRLFDLPCSVHRNDARLLRQAPLYALRFAHKQIQAINYTETFDDQFSFSFGDQIIKVIHTPGHTPGSVCFLLDNFIFTGDTLMKQNIGRTDLPGGDQELLTSSITRLLSCLPEGAVLFPGHGEKWQRERARTWWKQAAGSSLESAWDTSG